MTYEMPDRCDARSVEQVLEDAGLGTASNLERIQGGNFGVVWRATTGHGQLVVRYCSLRTGKSSFHRERLVLHDLKETDIPTPYLVWADKAKDVIVQTAMPGTTTTAIESPHLVAESVANILAALHAHTPKVSLPAASRPMDPYVPDWAAANPDAPRLHAIALDLERSAKPEPAVFAHGDYWTGNLLWNGAHVAGVVDWECAGVGYRGQDVAKMRFDLALLLGIDAAEIFQRQYEDVAGVEVPNTSYWDARTTISGYPEPSQWWLPSYRKLGYRHLDEQAIRKRFESYARSVIALYQNR